MAVGCRVLTELQYANKARRKWLPMGAWVSGGGRFALVRECGRFTVDLIPTLAEAKRWLGSSRNHNCGSQCDQRYRRQRHYIHDLEDLGKEPIYAA